MRRIYQFLVLLIFLISFASAADVVYTIAGGKVLVEIELDKEGIIILPESYSILESNKAYELSDNKLISGDAAVTFITKDYIKRVGNKYIFVLPRPLKSVSDIRVYLPQNHILSNSLVFPKNYNISTDGKNIILEWNNFDESEIIIFYEGIATSNFIYYIIAGVLLFIFVILFYFQQKKFKKKIDLVKVKQSEAKQKLKNIKKINVTKNLFGDEKRIVEYLLSKKNKSSWTKEIAKSLEISKVRLSRKIRILVEKDLIKKEPHGNENRISLKL